MMVKQGEFKPGDVSRAFWEAAEQGRFLLQRDVATGRSQFYPRAVNILGEGPLEITAASGGGELVALTTVRTPTPDFEAPYTVGIVKLDEGPRVFARLINARSGLAPGCRMKLVWETGSGVPRLFVFEPA